MKKNVGVLLARPATPLQAQQEEQAASVERARRDRGAPSVYTNERPNPRVPKRYVPHGSYRND